MPEQAFRGGYASRRAGQSQADAMLASLASVDPELLQALLVNPAAALRQHSGVMVLSVPESQTDTGCSVAGGYVSDTMPPTLAVATSVSAGRQDFTLLHEFGHHLQRTRFELMDALLEQSDEGRALEENACDAFAAGILLPAADVAACIGGEGPTAGSVAALWARSRASRQAACVRAAQTLRSPGHVLLLDDTGAVQFDAAHGLPPVRRRSSQADVPLIAQALRTGHRATGQLQLRYRDGIEGQVLHAQIADLEGYLVVVAVTDTVPWTRFAPPSTDTGPSVAERSCEHCGHDFTTFDASCETCRTPKCPECARCACPPRLAEQTCTACWLKLTSVQFDPGSDVCQSCS